LKRGSAELYNLKKVHKGSCRHEWGRGKGGAKGKVSCSIDGGDDTSKVEKWGKRGLEVLKGTKDEKERSKHLRKRTKENLKREGKPDGLNYLPRERS